MIDNQDISIIFDLIKSVHQIKNSDIAEKLGIPENQISSLRNGRKSIDENFVNLIWQTFPEIKKHFELVKNQTSENAEEEEEVDIENKLVKLIKSIIKTEIKKNQRKVVP